MFSDTLEAEVEFHEQRMNSFFASAEELKDKLAKLGDGLFDKAKRALYERDLNEAEGHYEYEKMMWEDKKQELATRNSN